MEKAEILVIGGSGFIGSRLVKALLGAGHSIAYTYHKNNPTLPGLTYQVNLFEENGLEDCILETKPRVIYYCVKPTLSSDLSAHKLVNEEGVRRTLESVTYSEDVRFVYLSSSAVFSGKNGPYTEESNPDPESVSSFRDYAITKYAGEQHSLHFLPNTIIARLSRVNGRSIQGELNPRISIPLEQLRSGQSLPRFSNRYISPILVDNLIECLLEAAGYNFSYRGILHLAGNQRITDYEYWLHIARRLGIDESLIVKDHSAVSDNSLINEFTQSMLETRFLNVEDQIRLMFQ